VLARTLGRLRFAQRLGLFQNRAAVSDSVFEDRFRADIELFLMLALALTDSCSDLGAKSSIALIPGISYINAPDSLSNRYQEFLRGKLVSELGRIPYITVINLAAAMQNDADRIEHGWYFPNDGHLSPQGHRYVADVLARDLKIRAQQPVQEAI